MEPVPAGRKEVHLSYHCTSEPVSWSLDRDSLPAEQIIRRLEQRLGELGPENMYVTILSPMEADAPSAPSTINRIEQWAKEQNVPVLHERSCNHVRGVTFGRPPRNGD